MPKLKTPPIPRDYLTRHELLAMVPLGMYIDRWARKEGDLPEALPAIAPAARGLAAARG